VYPKAGLDTGAKKSTLSLPGIEPRFLGLLSHSLDTEAVNAPYIVRVITYASPCCGFAGREQIVSKTLCCQVYLPDAQFERT
jgi:hypothetical protein